MKSVIIKNLKLLPFSILGIATIAFGIAMYRCVSIGIDPPSVFMLGLSSILGYTGIYTVGSYIIQGVCLALLLWKGRHLLGVGTVAAWFLSGPFVDWFTPLLMQFISSDMHMLWRIGIYLLGTVIIGFGGGLYMSVGIGGSPVDMFPVMLSEHTKRISFRYIRMIFDFLCLGLGILLGSTEWGIGSVITAFLVGPFFQFFMGKFKPVFSRM